MYTDKDKYEEVAREIKRLIESRFGELSFRDLREIAKLLGFEILQLKPLPKFNEFYEKLTDEERADLEFMMHM
jgi:hypothetical protein